MSLDHNLLRCCSFFGCINDESRLVEKSFTSSSRNSISQDVTLTLALASKVLHCVRVANQDGPGRNPTHRFRCTDRPGAWVF
jgi:hypothetical protein